MRIVYQIGRLDTTMKPLKFEYRGKIYEKVLSSFVFKEYFKNEVSVILVYPVSLPINRGLIQERSNLEDNLKNKIKNILDSKENYLNNPCEFFREHPFTSQADDFILIHSIGEYEGLKFECSYDDIVLEILFDMIERYLKKEFNEIYVDISSGLNIYVSALLEAVRHFYVFHRLQDWDNKKLKVYEIFSEPIIGSSANSYQIYNILMGFKAFFSSPISSQDINNYELSRKIVNSLFGNINNRELKNKLQKCFENFAIHFSAIKNATPLANYTFEYDEICAIEDLIKKIIILGKEKLSKDWKKSPQIPKSDFLKALLSLSFYKGIVKILKSNEISPEKGKGVALEELKKFEKLYDLVGLNLNFKFLGNEIRNLKKGKDRDGKTLSEKASECWKLLSNFIYSESNQFNPRNFFAHAGFERNITEVRKCNEQLYFRYKDNIKENIKKELMERM